MKRDRHSRTICGVGFLGDGDYISSTIINGKKVVTKEYMCWHNMIKRCYDKSEMYKHYHDVTVCDEWHNFQNFARWYNENYYEVENQKSDLDKDLLIKGNKIYSPQTCVFVPHYINSLLLSHKNGRGNTCIGVSYDKERNKYKAFISYKCKTIMLGRFTTEEQAFEVYKKEKEKYIKDVLNEYKDSIPKNVYDALSNYKIEITD